MAGHRRKGRLCKFESLENRNLLAGDVTARIHHGDLIIKGDALANGITITAGDTDGTVMIQGVDAGNSPTRVANITNGPSTGTSNGEITLSGFTGKLIVKMKGGDDNVSISELAVAGKTKLDGGDGDDTFTLENVTFQKSLRIDLDGGDDTLSLTNVEVTGKTIIKGERDDDTVTIDGSTFTRIKTKLGRGDDDLAITDTDVNIKAILNGGRGTNSFAEDSGNDFARSKITHFATTDSSLAVELGTVAPISENSAATVTGSFKNSDLSDAHTVTVDWDDPNSATDSVFTLGVTSALTSGKTFTSSDGSTLMITSAPTADGVVKFSIKHTYLDDGSVPGNATSMDNSAVKVTVNNGGGLTGSDTVTVVVNNAPPTVSDPADKSVSENSEVTLVTTITDVGTLDVFSATVNWGDGAASDTINNLGSAPIAETTIGGTKFTWSGGTSRQLTYKHTYLDDNPTNTASDPKNVTITVHDDDATTATATQTTVVTVTNEAPTISDPPDKSVSENSEVTLVTTVTDAGTADVFSATVNWDDGGTPDTISNLGSAPIAETTIGGTKFTWSGGTSRQLTYKHTYLDDNPTHTASDQKNVTITVHDDDATTANATQTTVVTVTNAAPTITLNPISNVNENGVATLTGSYTDLGLSDPHKLTVNWDDPNSSANSIFDIPATGTLSGTPTFTSTGADTTTTLTISSFNAATGVVTFTVQHQYLDDGLSTTTPPGGNNTASDTRTIAVSVADDDTQSDTKTTSLIVNNVAPVVALNAVSSVNENGIATLTGTYTDIGLSDVHKLTIGWGDSNNSANSVFDIPATRTLSGTPTFTSTGADTTTTLTITSFNATTGLVTFSVQHQYLDDGQSTITPPGGNNTASETSNITVTVADDDAQSDSKTTSVIVNNVAPTLTLNPVSDINENDVVTLSGSYTDTGRSDGQKLVINWDDPNVPVAASTFTIPAIHKPDGTTLLTTGLIDSTDGTQLAIDTIDASTGKVTFHLTHQYLDDGTSPGDGNATNSVTINATVTDDDGQNGTTSATFVVKNAVPTLTLTQPSNINEGDTATLNGSYTDTGLSDGQTVVFSWGDSQAVSTFTIPAIHKPDGTTLLATGPIASSTDGTQLTIDTIDATTDKVTFHLTHQYVDDGSLLVISASITDDDGAAATDKKFITVFNVDPAAAAT